MRSFFVDPEKIADKTAVVSGPDARHINRVLRLEPGDRIRLFDGTGATYLAEITDFFKNTVSAQILDCQPADTKNIPELHLGQALLKGDKMNFIIQKATELGVTAIQPFVSQYCVARRLTDNRKKRLTRISQEACKQCNRPVPPAIHQTADFSKICAAQNSFDKRLIFWEEEGGRSLEQVFAQKDDIRSIMVLIGPEGGFSREEITGARTAGWETVTLGSRILRAETATVATVAIIQYLLGNLSRRQVP